MALTKVNSAGVKDNEIVNADIHSAANIAGSKLADDSISLAKLEHGTGSNDGKFLRANNGADPSFETVNTDLVADTTPQLGGQLDTNNNSIKFGDSDKILLGDGAEYEIYNDSQHLIIDQVQDGGTTFIRSKQNGNITFDASDTGNQVAAKFKWSNDSTPVSSAELYYGGVKKAETVTGGFTITGTCTATTFSGSGANLTSLPAANITGALPAIDGSALTGLGGGVPSGCILIWSGASNAIPTGYVLCDGNNSTPDLRDKFVVGAGNSYSVAATGGATTDTVSISISGTTGNNSNGSGRANAVSYPNANLFSHSHSFSGSGSDTVNTLPPYYALCYIMKS